jgi:MFS family permease
MNETLLFAIVFASQILVISVLLPMRGWARGKYVLENCPPSTHPKLYAKPIEWHIRVMRIYMGLNIAIALGGIAIIVALILALGGQWDGSIVTPWSSNGEWDNAIVGPYFFLQLVPGLYLTVALAAHNKAMAKAPQPAVRTAELRRRRLTDFISPRMLAATALTYVAFVAFILYYQSFGFAWFDPWRKIAGVTFVYVVFAVSALFAVHGRNTDHHQPQQKRLAALKFMMKFLWIASIAVTAVVALDLVIELVLGHDVAEPIVASLICQLAGLSVMWPGFVARVNKGDFDVYRQDAQPT